MHSLSAGPDAIADSLRHRFERSYGTPPRIFRAPGRVNLVGEHTDYNDGFVMPAAIEFSTWVAAATRNDRILRVYSEHFAESAEFTLDQLAGPPRKHWSDFIRGVAAVLQESEFALSGANLMIHGEVPLGAGLSSSASLEVSTALALSKLSIEVRSNRKESSVSTLVRAIRLRNWSSLRISPACEISFRNSPMSS